jgi:putative transposase
LQRSPTAGAVRFTDEAEYFVSEASVYRLLKAHDLITSPAYIVIKAAEEFKDKTTAPNQLWQTDFTYLKITGWGWYYLSTVLDDFSRFIVAWKLCATMKGEGRHRHARSGAIRVWAPQDDRRSPTASAVG